MKLLVLLIVLAVLAAALWLRTVRQPPADSRQARPHRLDDSLEQPGGNDDETPQASAEDPRPDV